MLILDVGCGEGNPPARARVSTEDVVVGIDINPNVLRTAAKKFPQRSFFCAQAESLPFRDGSFHRVVSAVAVPYTDIPRTLAEIKRVLLPCGTVFISLHNARFTLAELRAAFPNPVALLYRVMVLANGLLFHMTGRVGRLPNGTHESFQTERGMTLALRATGFEGVTYEYVGARMIVECSSKVCGESPKDR